ncbi:unnamed protein product [Trichogramma brassicae]|uniref:Uncharacterized protein n=1 Tax=Trichogramma brassicae TaxID=86971 RepID=A0A6H5IVE2_9HYME|nr:unnamed protein product [Trichogramma brassicae]
MESTSSVFSNKKYTRHYTGTLRGDVGRCCSFSTVGRLRGATGSPNRRVTGGRRGDRNGGFSRAGRKASPKCRFTGTSGDLGGVRTCGRDREATDGSRAECRKALQSSNPGAGRAAYVDLGKKADVLRSVALRRNEADLACQSFNSVNWRAAWPVHLVAASIECACLRFSRRTQPSPYQATTPPIRPVPFTSAANRRDPRRAAFCVTPATRWSTRVVSDLVRGSVSTELIYSPAFRADPRTTTQLACPRCDCECESFGSE